MSASLTPTSETVLSTTAIAATAAAVTASALVISREFLWPRWAKILRGPLETALPHMSENDKAELVYRPDQFPGNRHVETPYGSIHVYEFGPEDGQKVLLVHGISTSCMPLMCLAEGLAKRGCRVMLFDLFGRGYTDGVGDIPHDERLYVSQILLVLASSPLSWSGTESINVIGYSLGGGIAAQFAATFPHMVKSLVLLAPAGLVRTERFGRITKFAFSSGLVPERILHSLTSRRLQNPISSKAKGTGDDDNSVTSGSIDTGAKIAAAELPDASAAAALPGDSDGGVGSVNLLPLEKRIIHHVRWMITNHRGFVPSFMSCVRHAPLVQQEEVWRRLSRRKPRTTVVFMARNDEIIHLSDYEADGLPLLGGPEHVHWKVFPGGHDFVITQANAILAGLDALWDMKAPVE